jgi:hypothetical protein
MGIEHPNAHQEYVFSEETWKTDRKAAVSGNPGIHQGGAGQEGAQDSQRLRGIIFDRIPLNLSRSLMNILVSWGYRLHRNNFFFVVIQD